MRRRQAPLTHHEIAQRKGRPNEEGGDRHPRLFRLVAPEEERGRQDDATQQDNRERLGGGQAQLGAIETLGDAAAEARPAAEFTALIDGVQR